LKKVKGNNNDPSTTCSYCGIFDIEFNEEMMMLHQFKDCVMVNIKNKKLQ